MQMLLGAILHCVDNHFYTQPQELFINFKYAHILLCQQETQLCVCVLHQTCSEISRAPKHLPTANSPYPLRHIQLMISYFSCWPILYYRKKPLEDSKPEADIFAPSLEILKAVPANVASRGDE